MEDTKQIVITGDSSMDDIRAALAEPKIAVEEPTKVPAAVEAKPEPVAVEPVAAEPETVPETVETKQEPEAKEEPLPEGVTKRIAKEVERQGQIQRKIDEAVSARKAKEAELAALAKSGSEPVPTTAAKDAKPVKPVFGEDNQTWGDYQKALATYEANYEKWLVSETRSQVKEEFTQQQIKDTAAKRWAEAIKIHGADFPELMEHAQAGTPEGLQLAISALDDWSDVAVYLAKNPAKRAELVTKFKINPYAAIATLGRIEDSLKPAPKPVEAKPEVKPLPIPHPLPAPPVKEGGGASVSTGAFDYEGASMAALTANLKKIRASR